MRTTLQSAQKKGEQMRVLILSTASALLLFAAGSNWPASAASARCAAGCARLVCNAVCDEKQHRVHRKLPSEALSSMMLPRRQQLAQIEDSSSTSVWSRLNADVYPFPPSQRVPK
jgi:hypothetical protein